MGEMEEGRERMAVVRVENWNWIEGKYGLQMTFFWKCGPYARDL